MRCPNCGNGLVDNAKFCPNCGTKLNVEQADDHSGDGSIINSILNEDLNTNDNLSGNTTETPRGNQQKSFVWNEKYTYIVIGMAAIIAIVGGLVVRSVKTAHKSEYAMVDQNHIETIAEEIDESEINESNEVYDNLDDLEEDEDFNETESYIEETERNQSVVEKVSTYEYVIKDISWSEAKTEAEEVGGHLAVITSEEEYKKVCEIANDSGLTYIWIGARVYSTSDNWYDTGWITGEAWLYDNWYPNEPSRIDTSDDVEELFLCLWNAKYDGSDIGWTFNDQRDDIVGGFPSVSGKVGYIIEFEE